VGMGPAPEHHRGRHVAPLVFLSVGGASLLVGTIFGLLAVSTTNDVFDQNPTYGEADAVRTQTLIADVGLGLGVIMMATGMVFLFADHPDKPPPTATSGAAPVARLRFDPVVGPHSGGGAFSLRF
jgi:hypothetical protein